MKSDNIFISITGTIGFVLLCVVYNLTFYKFNINWNNISGIIFGVYLYLIYLFLSFICSKPKNQTQYFQKTESHGKDREAYIH